MRTFLSALLCLWLLTQLSLATSLRDASELAGIFKARNATGTFVLINDGGNRISIWNDERAKQRFIPAATFRIANVLLSLDAGVVRTANEVISYRTNHYRTYETVRPLIYGARPTPQSQRRTAELQKAMRMPTTPIFRDLARQTGLERMRDGIAKLGYGNMEIGTEVDRFWRNGTLQISALEQAEFLSRLARGNIPLRDGALQEIKKLTLKEKTETYELHAKSGVSDNANARLGWWVGWVERNNEISSFALNFDINGVQPNEIMSIGRDCLRALGKL